MRKSIFLILFSVFFLCAFPLQGNAATQTKIILDGKELVLSSDVEVVNVNNNVMIPIRVVAENLKFKVDWNQKAQNVKIEQDSKTILLAVGDKDAMVQNEKVLLSMAPQIIKKTVVVPIRFVSEEMGLKVTWNNKDKVVGLTSNNQNNSGSLPPSSGTGNSSINYVNEINFANNQLIVSLDGGVTPTISRLKNPERIVVDFPNTTFGDISQSLQPGSMGKLDVNGLANITEVRYSLFKNEPAQVRIVIELNNANDVQLNQQYIADKLIVSLGITEESVGGTLPAIPEGGDSGKKVVVIDPGHGGTDPGTISITNKHEKDFNLALALKVQALLLNEPEIEVVMTRETDIYPTRTERVKLANKISADVFVSIHGNSVLSSPQASGTETYYYQRSSSKELADIIHKNLIKAIGFKDRGVKDKSLQVIRETTMPAVLLEIGFLSNSSEEKAMMSETVQQKAAMAIVDGIKEYLGQK
jgi:N-acetylmuramoyl-L-alanine amidase